MATSASPQYVCAVCERPLTQAQRSIRRTCPVGRCELTYRRCLESGSALCGVCGRPLSGAAASRGDPTCGHFECLRTFARYCASDASDPPGRCKICSVLLISPRTLADVCGSWECLQMDAHREAEARAAERAGRLAELGRMAEAQRVSAAREAGIADPESFPVTILPSFDKPLAVLPSERRSRYAEHLRSVIAELFARKRPMSAGDAAGADPDPDSPDSEPATLPSQPGAAAPDAAPSTRHLFIQACSLCRGKCCSHGGEHAYISSETILRYLERHPDSQPEDIASDYLGYVPQRTFDGSCVYHTESGCALPHEMRAATCDAFFCGGLHELRDRLAGGAPQRAFFVSTEDGDMEIVAMKFVDGKAPDPIAADPAD